MAWKKGESGNPGGRPAVIADVQRLARDNCEAAIRALVKICKAGTSEAARVSAATALLDRGYGKPPQFTTSDPKDFRRAVELSDDELATIASTSGDGAAETPADKTILN